MNKGNNQNCKISAIIPFYDAKDTIESAIQSVLNQTFQDFELIVVNDASNEKIPDNIYPDHDTRVKILNHKTNKGAAAARNTGIQNAKGKYVAFLDADDIWFPQKLATQFEYMENTPSELKASCASFEILRRNGNIRTRILSENKDWNIEILGGCTVSPGSTLIAERSLFGENEIGLYPSDMRRLEDWNWLLNYSYKYQLGIIEEPLAQIKISGYPRYSSVKRDSKILLNKQKANILKHHDKKQLGVFKAGLEIEKGATAFRNSQFIWATLHSIKAFAKSPKRTSVLMKRVLVKLANRDYGGFFQKIKE